MKTKKNPIVGPDNIPSVSRKRGGDLSKTNIGGKEESGRKRAIGRQTKCKWGRIADGGSKGKNAR